MYTVEEATKILKGLGLVGSEQIVRRWIREDKIKVVETDLTNYKVGYQITKDSLYDFINKKAPDALELIKENEKLKEEIKELKAQLNNKKDQTKTTEVNKPVAEKVIEKKVKDKKNTTLITRTEIMKFDLSYSREIRERLVKYLFEGVKPRQRKEVILKDKQRLNDYLKEVVSSDTFEKFDKKPNEVEMIDRRNRGEMKKWDFESMFFEEARKEKLAQEYVLGEGVYHRMLNTELIDILCQDKDVFMSGYDGYTNLKEGDLFINPLTKDKFKKVEDAVLSVISGYIKDKKSSK